MRRLSLLLERFKNLKPGSSTIEKEAKKIIGEIFDMEEKEYKIIYKKHNLIIKTGNSVFKNEVFLRREKILDVLNKKLGKRVFLKIWFE